MLSFRAAVHPRKKSSPRHDTKLRPDDYFDYIKRSGDQDFIGRCGNKNSSNEIDLAELGANIGSMYSYFGVLFSVTVLLCCHPCD
jgi:hypothetical protein